MMVQSVLLADFCHHLAAGWRFAGHPDRLVDPLADIRHHGFWSVYMVPPQ